MGRLFLFGIFLIRGDLFLFDFRVRAVSYVAACRKADKVVRSLNDCDDIYTVKPLNIDGCIPAYNEIPEQSKLEF